MRSKKKLIAVASAMCFAAMMSLKIMWIVRKKNIAE